MLNPSLAQAIVHQIMQQLGRNINIMDKNGRVMASGEQRRIGTLHEGALEVIRTGEQVLIDLNSEAKNYSGTKPGINLPIHFRGDIVGVVGITGTPSDVSEFGALVVMMTELLIERSYLQTEKDWMERSKGLLIEECLKEEPDLTKIKFKLKGLNLPLNPPFELALFKFGKAKSNSGDPYLTFFQLKDRLREYPVLYEFINDHYFLILNLKGASNHFHSLIPFLTDVFKENYEKVQVGVPSTYSHLNETRYYFSKTFRALNLTTDERVYPEKLEIQLLLDELPKIEKERFKASRLKDLTPQLIETLYVFFEQSLNLSQTAKALYVHRNTLIYRFEKIHQLTGRDPRNFKEAMELQLAIWLK